MIVTDLPGAFSTISNAPVTATPMCDPVNVPFETRVAPREQRAAVERDHDVRLDAAAFERPAERRDEVGDGVLEDRARRQLLGRRGERRAGAALADDRRAPDL